MSPSSGPSPHSRPGGYHHDNPMPVSSSLSSSPGGGRHDDSRPNSGGQHPPPPPRAYHGRRSTAALEEDDIGADAVVDHHHNNNNSNHSNRHADLERYHAEFALSGRPRQPQPQSNAASIQVIGGGAPVASATTARPSVGGGGNMMMHYATPQPEVDTKASRAANVMDSRRTAAVATPVATTSQPYSPVFMNRTVSTGSSGGTSVDSTIRRAQESMKSFQRSDDSAMSRLTPEEIPAPDCPAKPEEPELPLRTSRRCLERVRQELQQKPGQGMPSPKTTFVVGLPRRHLHHQQAKHPSQQVDLLTQYPHQFMSVACESCHGEMIVPKTAVMVECPNCRKVGAASCSHLKSVTA